MNDNLSSDKCVDLISNFQLLIQYQRSSAAAEKAAAQQ